LFLGIVFQRIFRGKLMTKILKKISNNYLRKIPGAQENSLIW
jgi:hypothetical protein